MLKRVQDTNSDTAGSSHHSSMLASMSHELDGQASVVVVEGELDLSTAPRLKWTLLDALEAGSTQLVVDLSQVTFMDSTALGVLVGVNRKLEPGVRLAIVGSRERVLQIFEFSGIDSAFAIFPSRAEALAYVRAQIAHAR
jgi:anti-sigma B factor antagonist